MQHILTEVLIHLEGDSRLAAEMKAVMREDLESRKNAPEVVEILGKCSFLDPRFKDQYLEDEGIQDTLITECLPIVEAAVEHVLISDPDPKETAPPPPAKRSKGLAAVLSHILSKPSRSASSLTPEEKLLTEISTYLKCPAAAPDTDPLVWWKADHFPTLACMAKKYLCICGTSVPSERLFSTAGHIVNAHRSRLLPKNVNMLLFWPII